MGGGFGLGKDLRLCEGVSVCLGEGVGVGLGVGVGVVLGDGEGTGLGEGLCIGKSAALCFQVGGVWGQANRKGRGGQECEREGCSHLLPKSKVFV